MLDVADRALFEAGAAILGIAFLVKAASGRSTSGCPSTYAAASAPVATVFAMMTKVGVYAVLRVGTLLASAAERDVVHRRRLVLRRRSRRSRYGVIGMLAAQQLGRLVAYAVVVSSGLLLMALGLRNEALTAPVMFYLVSSVLATGAFFMLSGMTERTRTSNVERKSRGYDAIVRTSPIRGSA